MKEINRHLIKLARESRGFNQKEFASLIDMSNSNIGKIENGDISVSEQNLINIATETDYPLQFFIQEDNVIQNLSWRKRKKVAQRLMVPIYARATINAMQVHILYTALKIYALPLSDLNLNKDPIPEKIAEEIKNQWGIKDVKEAGILKTFEDNGIIINSFDFRTSRIDSLLMLTKNKNPVISINSTLEGDRQRFTLAYELGQFLIYNCNNADLKDDKSKFCNSFAAEFLMPEKEIKKDFEKGVTFKDLALLKNKWKVSMIALLYRADDLGFLTPNQKRYIIQQFNESKIRRHEPKELMVLKEEPRLMKYLIGQLREKAKLSVVDTAALLCLQVGEFMEMYS